MNLETSAVLNFWMKALKVFIAANYYEEQSERIVFLSVKSRTDCVCCPLAEI
jgi:hypothetical protein